MKDKIEMILFHKDLIKLMEEHGNKFYDIGLGNNTYYYLPYIFIKDNEGNYSLVHINNIDPDITKKLLPHD